jgi:DNA adenine methylase
MRKQPWARTVIRLAGSKKRMLPLLMELVPGSFSRYVEPFAGSAALFFATRPERAVLADFNRDLVGALKDLARHPRRLHDQISHISTDKDTYYWMRDAYQPTTDLARSVRFFYLNRNCFNGIYRTNRLGQFNVPHGSGMGGLPSRRDFYRCSIALRSAEVVRADFRATLAGVQAGDFVYVDPPYMSRRATYGEYGYGSFSEDDMADLCEFLRRAADRGADVLLSYGSTRGVMEGLGDWKREVVAQRRDVAADPKHRRSDSVEVLVSNSLPVHDAVRTWKAGGL